MPYWLLGPDAQADIERYRYYDRQAGLDRGSWMTIFAHQGLQAMLLYRLVRRAQEGRRTFAKTFFLDIYPLISRVNDILTGMHIAPQASIGPGLFIAHSGGVVIGPGVTIGANCNLGNDVTIGGGSPTLGDRVMVAVGARVLGDITVGSDVAIGSNTVVVRDVEPRAVIVGGASRVVSHVGAFKLIEYTGAESDPERIAAIEAAAKSLPADPEAESMESWAVGD